jgi:hypothetical protein
VGSDGAIETARPKCRQVLALHQSIHHHGDLIHILILNVEMAPA